MMMNTLLSRLRSDRGATDPVLSIIAVFGTMIIGATVFATLIMTFNFIGNYSTEQSRAATLTTVSKAWALDANNASQVNLVGTRTAVFYEMPGRSPGVYQERGGGGFRDDCRKSVWTLNDGVLKNEVSYFDNEFCDLGSAPGTPSATTTAVTVEGFDEDAIFVAENQAGRDLHFNETGLEVGLSSTVPAAQQSVNTPDDYWRDYEWEWGQPSLVRIGGLASADNPKGQTQVNMPISGARPTDIAGKTWIVPTAQGDTLTDPEEQPEQTLYNPDPIENLRVERSATVGDIYGSLREGIQVTWDYVTCGPFTTEYTVTWTTNTVGAENHTTTFTSFGAFEPVQFEGVPNGSTGVVQVTAACPPSVSNATSADSVNYTQTLPSPVLAGSENSTRPHEHNFTWGPVSSLDGVRYRFEQSINGSAWTPSPAITPNPTAGTSGQLVYDTGSTYGQEHRYRAIAVMATVESQPSNLVTITTPWPPISAPTITGTNPTNAQYQTTISAISCPAGTNAQYHQRYRFNTEAWSAWTTWGTQRTVTTAVGEGVRIQVEGQVRCAYNAAQFSPTQNASNTAQWIRPITTVPTPPDVEFTDPSADADPVPAEFETTGCPALTTPEFRFRFKLNDAATFGAWSNWSGDTTALITMLRGEKVEIEVMARCVSPHAQGPESPTTEEEWIRPIPAPPGLTGLTTDAGGTAEPINNRVINDAAVCPAGTTAEYRYRQTTPTPVGAWTDWGPRNHNVETAWGRYYVYEAVARCISPYIASDPSPVRNTTWTTNLPYPDRDALISLPAQVTMDEEYPVTVTQTAICKAGTDVRYILRGTNDNTRAWVTSGWSTFETDMRAEPSRWTWPTVQHMAPKAEANFYGVEYTIIAVCDGPDRDADPDNPLEAASTDATSRAVYPTINDRSVTSARIDEGGTGTNTTSQGVFTATGCAAGQWPEFQYRFRVNTTSPASAAWSNWSAWGDTGGRDILVRNAPAVSVLPSEVSVGGVTATVANTNLVGGANQAGHIYVRVPVQQGHRFDIEVNSRCIDPYVEDVENNKGPIAPTTTLTDARSVESPQNRYLEQPFWSGMPHGTTRSIGMSATCVAPTALQFQWRNDGAGGNTGTWQGWFGTPTTVNGNPGFRTSDIRATWSNWYGSSANYRCVGAFEDSPTEFAQTGGVQTQRPPQPSGVGMSVSGSNVDSYRGSYYVGSTSSTASASWSASVSGACPEGTYQDISWDYAQTQSAAANVYSGSVGRYYSGWQYRTFGASVRCVVNDNGDWTGWVGTGTQGRQLRAYADFTTPPAPAAVGGGSFSEMVVSSDRRGVTRGSFYASSSAYATGYTGSARSLWAGGYSTAHGAQNRSTPSFTFGCAAWNGGTAGWTGTQASIVASNAYGSSGASTFSVSNPTSQGGPVCL